MPRLTILSPCPMILRSFPITDLPGAGNAPWLSPHRARTADHIDATVGDVVRFRRRREPLFRVKGGHGIGSLGMPLVPSIAVANAASPGSSESCHNRP